MAEKMANSIGRELRYFEYKFRKKQSTKKNKKNKAQGPGPELAWSDSPQSDEFRYQSEDMKKAVPTNKNEEDLQIQVALAMSREEEKERERQQESDKIRLEMALKESKKETAKPVNQPTLLDLSAERPPRVSAPVPTAAASAPFASAATNDPWGGGATAPAAPTATFDPFAPPPVQASYPAGTGTDGFGMSNGNAWAATSAPAAPPSTSLDPWGTTVSTAAPVAAPAFSAAASNDPWGAQAGATQPQAEPVYATIQKDTWGKDPFLSTQPSAVPATLPTIPPLQNGNAWGTLPVTTPATTDAFGSTPATVFHQSTFDTPPTFDPLKDFDSLHIGGNAEPSPVLLHKDFGTGQNSSVAKDIFPVGQLLEPEQVDKQQSAELAQPQAAQKTTADQFLGENSSLVNLSSWQTYQVPYVTKPLGTQSHNPFAQTGPQKTLNEMRSGTQQTFAQPAFH